MIDVIPLRYGTIFKRVFSKPNIFREFVHAATGIEVEVDQVHTEYEYPEQIGNVNIKYDIFAEDEKQRIIIEIQHIKEEDFFYRFLYYHLISIVEQVRRYDEYETPKAVYTIVVLTSTPRDGSIDFSWGTNLFNLMDEYGRSHELAPHRLIFMNPRQRNPKTPDAVKPWLELIEDSLDKKIDERNYPSQTFQEILAEIRSNTMSPEESAAIKDESAWEKAKDRFRREGLEEGREEGLEEGREEGRRQQQEASAKILLAKGLEPSMIAEATGLTEEEINELLQADSGESDKPT